MKIINIYESLMNIFWKILITNNKSLNKTKHIICEKIYKNISLFYNNIIKMTN